MHIYLTYLKMKDKSPTKIKIATDIFHIQSDNPIEWKDIKHIEFQDSDHLTIGRDEGYYSENNSWDPHYYAIVTRMIEETDEEFNLRIKDNERDAKWAKNRRYDSYLKLKEEFENKIPG